MQQECEEIDVIVLDNTVVGEEAYDQVQDGTNKEFGVVYLPNTCRQPPPVVQEQEEQKQLNGE